MEIIPDSCMIGYVHPGTVTEGFARSLAELCLYKPNNIYGIIATSNPRQEDARNATLQKFVEGMHADGEHFGAEWFMWLDTDQTCEADAIERLRNTAKRFDADAAGGITWIWKRAQGEVSTNGFLWNPNDLNFDPITEYETGDVYEINGTGSAFVLIHRRVIEAQDGNWQVTHIDHPATGRYMGHDLAFFHKMSVEGPYKLVWDTGVQAGHIKQIEFTEAQFRGYQASIE